LDPCPTLRCHCQPKNLLGLRNTNDAVLARTPNYHKLSTAPKIVMSYTQIVWGEDRGVNATGDAGDASLAIFGQPDGISYIPQSLSYLFSLL